MNYDFSCQYIHFFQNITKKLILIFYYMFWFYLRKQIEKSQLLEEK